MRIVFFGTPEPAAGILETLLSSKHEIVGVCTQPDRPKGRGQKLAFPPVKEAALKHGLKVEQPEKVKNNPAIREWLEALKPDIAVVVAYGKILPKEILSIPRYGFVNVHASLLPKYRGAAPIQQALLNGEKETGVTIMKVDALLDTGAIILQQKFKIEENDDTLSLSEKLFAAGGPLLLKALEAIDTGKAVFTPQKEAEATYAPLITKEEGEIDWKKSAQEINNRVRALVTWPTAHTFCHGKMLKVLKVKVVEGKKALPGTIVEIIKQKGLVVETGNGAVLILAVQPAGGKPMSAYDFVIGHDVKTAETLPN